MKWVLAVLCVILSKIAVEAQLITALANGERVNFGPLNAHVKVGKLPPKYKILSNADITAAKNMVVFIEKLRPYFETGTQFLPPLEPFVKSEIEPFTVKSELIGGTVALRDVTLAGLKRFQLHTLETRVNGYRIDFNITFPLLEVDVDYTTDTVLAGYIPLSFAGHVNGNIEKLNIVGAVRVDAVRYLDKTIFQVRAVDALATGTQLEGQMSGLNLGEAAAVIDTGNLGAQNPLIQAVKHTVAESITKVIGQELNELLLNHSASAILNYLYTGSLSH